MAGFMANMQPNMNMMPNNLQQTDQSASSAADRALRSVFVGNIPYDATEEQLREVFVQAGPVVSFRLVYDRETGKPKGYGFCEYQDTDTAASAMRNLNNHDFSGRQLRVGVAAGEQSKDDGKSLQQALGGQVLESPYGEPCEPEKAPEAISKAVASLPPEQMFELMKQMKLCIQNSPNEARNMLLQNPQLAYALLQAQIVMKIVDPQMAMSIMYRDESQPQVNMSTINPQPPAPARPQQPMTAPRAPQPTAPSRMMGMNMPMPAPPRPDMVLMQPSAPRGDMGEGSFNAPSGNIRGVPAPQQQRLPSGPGPSARSGPPQGQSPVTSSPSMPGPSSTSVPSTNGGGPNISTQDQEKAALIMQVLQLTDEQIALLPPEQRQSILILKEQIKSQ